MPTTIAADRVDARNVRAASARLPRHACASAPITVALDAQRLELGGDMAAPLAHELPNLLTVPLPTPSIRGAGPRRSRTPSSPTPRDAPGVARYVAYPLVRCVANQPHELPREVQDGVGEASPRTVRARRLLGEPPETFESASPIELLPKPFEALALLEAAARALGG